MWNEPKQKLFDDLRDKKLADGLTEEEQRQLELLSEELDREDEAYLRLAFEYSRQSLEKLDAVIAQKESDNTVLAMLAEQQARLLTQAQLLFEDLQYEQRRKI